MFLATPVVIKNVDGNKKHYLQHFTILSLIIRIINKANVLTSELINGLKTTVDAILPVEIANKEKLPDTFNLENIRSLFETRWKTAFGKPLAIIELEDPLLLSIHRNELKEFFDFDHQTSSRYHFRLLMENVFVLSEIETIQNFHLFVIRNPLIWWNNKNKYLLQISCDIAPKTMSSSSSISSNLPGQTMEYSVMNDKTVKAANLRPGLAIKDCFCRMLFKGKSMLVITLIILLVSAPFLITG